MPDHVTYTWLVMIILAGVAFMATRRLELVPRGAQSALEIVLDQFQYTTEDVMGAVGQRGRRARRRPRRGRHHRVHGDLSLSLEASSVLPPGVHLRHADDAVHLGSDRRGGPRSRCGAPRRGPSLAADHTYRGGRSCDVHRCWELCSFWRSPAWLSPPTPPPPAGGSPRSR